MPALPVPTLSDHVQTGESGNLISHSFADSPFHKFPTLASLCPSILIPRSLFSLLKHGSPPTLASLSPLPRPLRLRPNGRVNKHRLVQHNLGRTLYDQLEG